MDATSKGRIARTATRTLAAIGAGALILKGVRLGMEVFGPTRPYRLQGHTDISPDSEQFLTRLACVVDSLPHRDTRITILKNGDQFYPAELEVIDAARESINLEAYEFLEGAVTREFIRHLAARPVPESTSD